MTEHATPTKTWRMWDHNNNLIETWTHNPPPSSELISTERTVRHAEQR